MRPNHVCVSFQPQRPAPAPTTAVRKQSVSATQTVIKVSAGLPAVAKPERSGEEAATVAVRKKAHHRVTLGIPGTPQTYAVTTNAQMPDS
ncbi:hypothetical protein PI124_g10222 [Phytophthora idaei]|nr:hypothetical protein PI125_g18058 [Phytophthora idaei]KAG3155522.1 hypothetical protein PI126_g9130 [Phytophthora idaei]KAG3245015.1 hypothetical protein PI124_g10222 [Phytophthora idaei]